MASAKKSLPLPVVMFVSFGSLVVLGTAYGLYGKRYIKDLQYERAEAYASSLYDKLKEKKSDVEMES